MPALLGIVLAKSVLKILRLLDNPASYTLYILMLLIYLLGCDNRLEYL
jgi:hypothetical protein